MDAVLEAEKRDGRGKNEARRLRAQGRIPAVVYGAEKGKAVEIAVDPKTLLRILHSESGVNTLIGLKLDGGDNGHNGLRSVTASLGSPDYYRVRFGIGRPPGRMDPAAFVLRDFSAAERKELPFLIDRAADAVEALLSTGLAAAQNAFHGESPAAGG